jgi:hypothetical protein
MRTRIYTLLLAIATAAITCPASAQISDDEPDAKPENNITEHAPGTGLLVGSNKYTSLTIATLANLRYLNQLSTNPTYTDAFGRVIPVQRRNDLLLSKLNIYFRGWIFSPKFRFNVWYWTSNANMGQGAQVVGAGDIKYEVNKHLTLAGGVQALPCVRTTLYNFPNWPTQDARAMADEYFRGSYTMGIWIQGELVKNVYYKSMLGDNLSILGVDAGQLDNGFDTWSTSLWWVTNDYGRQLTYTDFEHHCKPATALGGAYTRSNETKQSQPTTEDPENSQIRLSDGTGIFGINALAPSSQITAAKYEMATLFGGIKFKGFSLDIDVYARWISKFKTVGVVPESSLFDDGFTAQAAYMIMDKKLDVHVIGSYINGEYGLPWDLIGGLNFYPFKNRTVRINADARYSYHSPVGYLAYPAFVGSTGVVYIFNVELNY